MKWGKINGPEDFPLLVRRHAMIDRDILVNRASSGKSKINGEPLFGSWRPHCGKCRLSLLASLAAFMNAPCCCLRAASFCLSSANQFSSRFLPTGRENLIFHLSYSLSLEVGTPLLPNALSLRACYAENNLLKMKACLWRGGGSPPCNFKSQSCKELFFFFFFREVFNPAFTDASTTSSSFLSGV